MKDFVETTNYYIDKWNSEEYIGRKIKNFELIDQYYNIPFKNILDIGCGKAYESREFSKKYGSKLYLIEGDADKNNKKLPTAATGKYHYSADDFLHYFPLDLVKKELDRLGTTNYELIDSENIIIPDDVKFDLITSYLSCGFHYPIATYRDLIIKHSHENTKMVFDLRNRKGTLLVEEGIEVIHKFLHGDKYAMCEIKFK
jgi:hypothetical protein